MVEVGLAKGDSTLANETFGRRKEENKKHLRTPPKGVMVARRQLRINNLGRPAHATQQ